MKKITNICVIIVIFIVIITVYFTYNKKVNMEVLKDSLVYIESISDDGIANGSGFVYESKNGFDYILTNYHIIMGYNKINIYNKNKDELSGSVQYFNKEKDIAIIKIKSKLSLKPIKLGNSDKINVSDTIYSLGTPIDFNYFGTFSEGIISSTNRKINVEGNMYNAIQIDANISEGNSGGPLINKKGEVIGIIFIKEKDVSGISFAIPINDVLDIIKLTNK